MSKEFSGFNNADLLVDLFLLLSGKEPRWLYHHFYHHPFGIWIYSLFHQSEIIILIKMKIILCHLLYYPFSRIFIFISNLLKSFSIYGSLKKYVSNNFWFWLAVTPDTHRCVCLSRSYGLLLFKNSPLRNFWMGS